MKPVKIVEPHWDYSQIEAYLSRQMGRDLNFFWEWLINAEEHVRNRCLLRFSLDQHLSDIDTPDDVKEVLRTMKEEFSEDNMIFWIEW